MLKNLILHLKLLVIAGSLYYIPLAISQEYSHENSFRRDLLDYIESNSKRDDIKVFIPEEEAGIYSGEKDNPFEYVPGDWERYVVSKKYKVIVEDINKEIFRIEDEEDVDINSYGSMKLNLKYGKSKFTKGKYKLYDEDRPVSRIIQSGFSPEHEIQLHVEGHVGKRMTLYIDHDSRKEDNQYRMQYRAVEDKEVIREINAGEINVKLENSKYVVYDDNTVKAMGIDLTLKKDKFKLKAFGSVTKGETEVELFRGNSQSSYIKLLEYQYARNTYYQLEPFKRYDGLESPPQASDDPYNTLVTFTSSPSLPGSYVPYTVNIDSSGFELFMDDQDPYNNFNAVKLDLDGGYYTKLVSGVDYVINYSTGLISMLRAVPDKARIYALYTINGRSTSSSDPSARLNIFPGRIFVFIKYGYTIDEDINRDFIQNEPDRNFDGVPNYDIYEVRSFYYIGEKQLLEDRFGLQFYRENGVMTRDEISRLGKFSVDYSAGVIRFNLREPFKQLLGANKNIIYAERQVGSVYNYSQFRIGIDYYRETRNFQLKHFNIIPDSVRVKVNGRNIPSSLFTMDYTSGFFQFTDPTVPVITGETEIEIKYEYLPFAGQSQSFVGGFRGDYQFNRNLDFGGTLLFNRTSTYDVIPNIGSEPEQVLVFEGDTKLHLGQKKIKNIINDLTGLGLKSVPIEVNAYGEYAKSYRKINTFGKALIDDMESTDEIIFVSLSDKDWILSSMPMGALQTNRGIMYYYYYRELSDSGTLRGEEFSPYNVSYSAKPGPYNIATGHVDNSIQAVSSQKSLVMDFDFGSGEYVSMVTRKLSSDAVDFSSLQYVEFWYRAGGGTGEVEVYIDLGRVNEDSDGDNLLDSEDANNNGFLDTDPSAGIFEDRGYIFNPSGGFSTRIGTGPGLNNFTQGDGILNNEDLNGNGVLDTSESVITIPGDITDEYTTVNPVIVNLSDTSWRKVRIYINKASSAYQANPNYYEDILKQVEAVRFYIKKRGTANSGRVLIDSLKFVSSRWKDIKINDIPQGTTDAFKVTIVDTYNDDDYRADAFIFQQRDVYTSLHGDRNDRELSRERESALLVNYNLSGNKGSVTRKFLKAMDLRFYKTFHIWLNYRAFSAGDILGIKVGSSEQDYIEYRFPMDYQGIWRDISLRLREDSSATISKYQTIGDPDMKRIVYVELAVYGNSGSLWVNDIYVGDPVLLKDSAYWYEGEVKFKRPLFYTASGVPVISDISIKYIHKGHGSQFSSLGKTVNDMRESFRELYSSMNILPNWSARLDFLNEESETDSLNEDVNELNRGKTSKRSILFETDYRSDSNGVPSVKIVYKQDNYRNIREEDLVSSSVSGDTRNKIYTPALVVQENIAGFLGGNLNSKLLMDMVFKEERVTRSSSEMGNVNLMQLISLEEKERRQGSRASFSMDYSNKLFFLSPALELGTSEVVELSGKRDLNDTKILSDVKSNFHLPFITGNDARFVERNKKCGLNFGLKDLWIISPEFRIDMSYFENGFRDYDEIDKNRSGRFSRSKDARSYLSNQVDFPLTFGKIKMLKFIRSFNISFSRKMFFDETSAPYEGEGSSVFNEDYGINRVYNGLADTSLNLFEYPPWYFLKGRGNYSNGRDYANNKFNKGISYDDGTAVEDYNNNLRLIDNISLSSTFDLGKIIINYGGGINQVSQRQMIYGIPQQSVTFNQNINIGIDLMKIFHAGFFRPNKSGIPHHSASFNINYDFNRNMLITSNVEENVHSPGAGVTFKRDRASLGLRGSLDYRRRNKREYISLDETKRSRSDDIYITNLNNLESFREVDRGYSFSILYETDVLWIYRTFSLFYKLVAYPIFSLEYSLLLDRYDYSQTASPEPYDQHLITSKLTLDLHKNVQGGLEGRWALEKFRNRDTNGVYREIISYEIGFNFVLLF